MREFERIRAAIIRGGTSKGVYILEHELPSNPVVRDQVILSIYGNDERQIDGLGGADALTSKFAMVSVSTRADADIAYTFGQVGIGTKTIDYGTNCGNILSGVGPYAIDEGLVPPVEPITKVRIYNTNTNKVIIAHVPVFNGRSVFTGDFSIDGVPGTGAQILLEFENAAGAVTGSLFPTGNRKDTLSISYGDVEVSILDVTTAVVFLHAQSIGLKGTELPSQLTVEQLHQLEEIRSEGARLLGFVQKRDQATAVTPASPKLILVHEPCAYQTTTNQMVRKEGISFVSRAMSMQKMHHAFPVTGGLCTAIASQLKGTVVADVNHTTSSSNITIGHPSGTMGFSAKVEEQEYEEPIIKQAAVARTSRRLMEGYTYVPRSIYWQSS
ncbi:2-methylaconitate cis-trans isomerase PrpF family protein [Shouchella miscanthi]|uniref:PrpF domain-containing protein n=1 Tax=Shouchella miscanthi TaxID=2598861 RepID=A0ABU6NMA0_9BACI|nr:PrpF domain-containing protein [Shouchella miscanthi]